MLDDQRPRRVVPRWRSSWVTAGTAEARSSLPGRKGSLRQELDNKHQEFTARQSVPVASELMFLAISEENEPLAREAASTIVTHAERIGSTQLVATARRVLDGHSLITIPSTGEGFIRDARRLLKIDYRNPILLIDLARELTSKGHVRSALRYVRAASALAPQTRFVARCAARYFLHIGEPEAAHEVIQRSPNLLRDPWLQASEIAISTVQGKTSLLTKRAIRQISAQKLVRVEYSELASAVATIEMLNGSERKAKKLFRQALQSPNDNSLAQAEWASARLGLVVDESALSTPLSFEANSNHAYRQLNIADAIAFATEWSDDEPFSSRPFGSLSFLYSINEDFANARQAAEKALRVDGKDDVMYSLNVLFAKIQEGEFEGADQALAELAIKPQAKDHAVHLFANAGALAFAASDLKRGREFYEKAIQIARRRGNSHDEALARAFFARAAIMYADPNAATVLRETALAVEKLPSPGALYMVKKLVNDEFRKRLQAAAEKRVAKRQWRWDVTTNTLKTLE